MKTEASTSNNPEQMSTLEKRRKTIHAAMIITVLSALLIIAGIYACGSCMQSILKSVEAKHEQTLNTQKEKANVPEQVQHAEKIY